MRYSVNVLARCEQHKLTYNECGKFEKEGSYVNQQFWIWEYACIWRWIYSIESRRRKKYTKQCENKLYRSTICKNVQLFFSPLKYYNLFDMIIYMYLWNTDYTCLHEKQLHIGCVV